MEQKKKGNFKDITGLVFGKLTVISRAGSRNGKAYWDCTCECGGSKKVVSASLLSGKTQSCGCIQVGAKVKYRNLLDESFDS